MISAIPAASIHAITSNQVVISLETAVKELIENSLDAGATNLEIRFKQHGVKGVEVIDNGCGIAEADWESIGLKHHTSKIEAFADLSKVQTFGFRGEALSSLCALCDEVTVITKAQEAVGVVLELDKSGKVKSKKRIARQRGTTVSLVNPFAPLPVRRKEFERNAKREYGKALSLLQAYALVPCSRGRGVRLLVSNTADKGSKSTPIQTQGTPSLRGSVTALWGPKALDGIQDLDLEFDIPRLKPRGKQYQLQEDEDEKDAEVKVRIRGLISSPGNGRNGADRQFIYVNSRPCSLNKIQKTFNEVFRSFTPNHNTANWPLVIADFEVPPDTYDVNVTPDKRTIFLHNEVAIVDGLKTVLEKHFSPSRSTFDVLGSQRSHTQGTLNLSRVAPAEEDNEVEIVARIQAPKRARASSDVSSSEATSPSSLSLIGTHSFMSTPPIAITVPVSSSDMDEPMDTDELDTSSTSVSLPDQRTLSKQASPGPSQGKDKGIVVNTLFASWARAATGQKAATTKLSEDEHVELEAPKKKKTKLAAVEDEVPEPPKRKIKKAFGNEENEEHSPPSPTQKQTKLIPTEDSQPKMKLSKQTSSMEDDERELVVKPINGQKQTKLVVEKKAGKQAMLEFRSQLQSFARTGSTVKEEDIEEEEIDKDEDQEECSAVVATIKVHQEDHPEVEPLELDMLIDDISETLCDLTGDDELTNTNTSISIPSSSEPIIRPEVIRTTQNGDVRLRFDLKGVVDRWSHAPIRSSSLKPISTKKVPAAAGLDSAGDADTALARVISKSDFGQMEILGQFNLGFIIMRRRTKEGMDDLFIVDQHAADEKYNFETLQETTVIKSQTLLRPRPLELTAADELVAVENLDVLRKNGFEVEDSGEDQEIEEIGAGRLRLIAQPVSKSTDFDMKDLEELIHLLHDRTSGQMVRCSKARSMFAMRACRKSVMVGMPLTKSQMTSVVRHMGKMDQPWNCPHGRPTMRHLQDLANIRTAQDRRSVDWSSFGA